jgi:hypothetical protein
MRQNKTKTGGTESENPPSYEVFAFRQQKNSPIQLAFVAPAGQVMSWAGVPRKSDELLTGYQRFLDDVRIKTEVLPFFQNPMNCSPTAAIVALRKNAGMNGCDLRFHDGSDDVGQGVVKPATLIINQIHYSDDSDQIFEDALAYVKERLAFEASEPDDNDEGEISEDDLDIDSDDEQEEPIHLGSETLVRMKKLLEDKSNWNRKEFRDAIADYVKPAFLIDGQHRIAAAAKLGKEGLPFMLCGLFDASWEEQVFHFTVVNLKPKKIPPNLITSIAALSLTRTEQVNLETRLENAGVRMWEVSLMSQVSFNKISPFYEKVDMSVGSKNQSLKLGYGSMKRVASVWYRCSYTVLTRIARILSETKSDQKAKRNWKDEGLWFDFFRAFWSEVRDSYSEILWQKQEGNRLFNGATLWALQESMLQAMSVFPASTWTIEESLEGEQRSEELQKKFRSAVSELMVNFPEKLWTDSWTRPSQDTTPGRSELAELFSTFIKKGTASDGVWDKWKTDDETKSWFKKD